MLVSRIAERSLVGAASILTVPIVADSPLKGTDFSFHTNGNLTVFFEPRPSRSCTCLLHDAGRNRLNLLQTGKLPEGRNMDWFQGCRPFPLTALVVEQSSGWQ